MPCRTLRIRGLLGFWGETKLLQIAGREPAQRCAVLPVVLHLLDCDGAPSHDH